MFGASEAIQQDISDQGALRRQLFQGTIDLSPQNR